MNSIVIKTGKDKYKILTPDKYYIDRNTPVGDDADFWEIKPFDGRKLVFPLLYINKKNRIEHSKYKFFNYEKNMWDVKNVPESLVRFLKEKGYE